MLPEDSPRQPATDPQKEIKEARKNIEAKQREYEALKQSKPSQLKDVMISKGLEERREDSEEEEDKDAVLQRINLLKQQARYRKAVPVETKRINAFAPITADQCKHLTEKLRQAKALQQENLRTVDITDLGKEYEQTYHNFLEGMSRSDNRLQQACTSLAIMKQYCQLLREPPNFSELELWNKQPLQPSDKIHVDWTYQLQQRKFELKEEPEDTLVADTISKAKEYFKRKYDASSLSTS